MFPQFPSVRAQSFLSASEHYHCVLSGPSDFVQMLLKEDESLRSGSLPPIFAALELLDACPTLRDLLATFPPHIHYAIKASLLLSDPYQRIRLQVLEMLFDKDQNMGNVLGQVGRVSPSCLFYHTSVFGVIEGMCAEPSKYRLELAFLFAQLPIHRLPQHLQQKMAISSIALQMTVLPAYSYWHLCSQAEPLFQRAMEHQAVLLVNGVILLKFNGKLSGLALQTTLLADGTQLIEGCWYAPIDHRDQIRDAFDRGESRLCVEGKWALIRALDDFDNRLLQQAQTFVAELPAQLLLPQEIATYSSRQAYRYRKYESFD